MPRQRAVDGVQCDGHVYVSSWQVRRLFHRPERDAAQGEKVMRVAAFAHLIQVALELFDWRDVQRQGAMAMKQKVKVRRTRCSVFLGAVGSCHDIPQSRRKEGSAPRVQDVDSQGGEVRVDFLICPQFRRKAIGRKVGEQGFFWPKT